MNKLKIIFFGTSDFGIPTLEILLNNEYEVAATVTIPDKAQGRGQKIKKSAVKEYSEKNNIMTLQPENLKDPEFLSQLQDIRATLYVIVAFRKLPSEVWKMPKHGTVNLHGSLLPQYRGAAPINWAIINGEEETGVTTFFIDDKIDTGNIAFLDHEIIHPADTAGDLYDRLKIRGARLMLKTVRAIENGDCPRSNQPPVDPSLLMKAPKIHKGDCKIDWNKTSIEIKNFVRGVAPSPGSWTTINERKIKVFEVDVVEHFKKYLELGEIFTDNKTFLHIGTSDGAISIRELQIDGKKRMFIDDFFRGNSLY